jgi:hypothetical protein
MNYDSLFAALGNTRDTPEVARRGGVVEKVLELGGSD